MRRQIRLCKDSANQLQLQTCVCILPKSPLITRFVRKWFQQPYCKNSRMIRPFSQHKERNPPLFPKLAGFHFLSWRLFVPGLAHFLSDGVAGRYDKLWVWRRTIEIASFLSEFLRSHMWNTTMFLHNSHKEFLDDISPYIVWNRKGRSRICPKVPVL